MYSNISKRGCKQHSMKGNVITTFAFVQQQVKLFGYLLNSTCLHTQK